MNKPVLVIMAAGMGSRYGGLKQIDTVDDENDKIIDFSVYDAKRAGFEKVIFIIKRENLELFREAIGNRAASAVDVEYVFQEMSDIPEGGKIYENRTKPYGTAHAVRSVRKTVNTPFAVINADDYYGPEAFKKVYDHLEKASGSGDHCMVGFRLGNTLTANGSVSRGICSVDDEGHLVDIVEHTKIIQTADGAAYIENGEEIPISADSITSMNMWGFTPDFLEDLDRAFVHFYEEELPRDPQKAECYLPFVVDDVIRSGKAKVKVLDSSDKWFGVTYREDKEYVRDQIKMLKKAGVYPVDLWKN